MPSARIFNHLEAPVNTTLRAALWMTGSIASFSFMAVAGRALAPQFDTFEIMMYRSLFGVLAVLIIIAATGAWREIRYDRFGLHFVRNVAHFTGQNLWFFAVTAIPLAQVFALEFTSPIWVIVLSPFILGERLTLMRVVAVVLGFIGILIVARPDPSGLNAGLVAAGSAAIFFALTIMITKRLTRTQTITCILFHLTTMQLVFGLIAAGYDGDVALPDADSITWLALVGVAGLLAHWCLTHALAIAPATVVVPIDFVRLPVIAVIGMLLYAEALDIWVFVGALVIFGGNYLNLWTEARRRPDAIR